MQVLITVVAIISFLFFVVGFMEDELSLSIPTFLLSIICVIFLIAGKWESQKSSYQIRIDSYYIKHKNRVQYIIMDGDRQVGRIQEDSDPILDSIIQMDNQ